MLRVGDVLAERYRLDDRIGGGGMGDVWRGEDVVLNRTVAVKVLHAKLAEEDNFRERFRREACAIAALESPNIVDVYDYGEVDTPRGVLAFLVMPYVDARPLSRHLAYNGRLDTTETLDIVAQVADGLDVAHRAGIIHRDVKPGNILVGDNGRVTLVDFGIARTSGDMTMTTAGVVLGTVTYMSPEQASGERLTPASDIYSLGVVAYQCLTGSPPFKADTPLGVLSAHLKDVPPRLPDEIPAPVPDLVVRALAKELGDRWPTADDFADACRSAGSSTRHQAIAPSAPPEVRQARFPGESATVPRPETASSPNDGPPRQAHRGVLILGVAVLMAVLLATAATMRPWEGRQLVDVNGHTSSSAHSDDAADIVNQDRAEAGGGHVDVQPPSPEPSTSPEAPTTTTTHSASPSSPSSSPTTEPVPDVRDLPESEARQTLNGAGFEPEVAYEGEGENHCGVVSQQPEPGETAELGSTVHIVISRGDICTGG